MFAAMLRRHYCKTHMTAYVNGGLSPRARGRIARYIEGDPACYAEYRRQRELSRELRSSLPALGAPTPRQLDRVWGAIQAELNLNADRDVSAPATAYRAAPRRRASGHSGTGYKLAGVMLTLCLALPLAVMATGGTASARAVPTPPVPRQVAEIAQTQRGADALTLALPPNVTPEAPQAETAQVVTRATPTATQQ